jgi:hypothetical protein
MRALLGLCLLVTACSATSEPREQPTQHLPRPTDPSLTVLVSNQSFAQATVDLTIEIDGVLAITGDFDVEGQHTWVPFDFSIAPGDHVMAISTVAGSASLEQPFTMDDRRWAVVSFWGEEEGDSLPIELTAYLYDEEPAFD